MDKAGPDTLRQLEEQRDQYLLQFAEDNDDLGERMRQEGVSFSFDAEEDLIALTIGPAREAVSFSIDGDLYLRTELETDKLVSVELYNFRGHTKTISAALKVFAAIFGIAHKAGLLPYTELEAVPATTLKDGVRELVAV